MSSQTRDEFAVCLMEQWIEERSVPVGTEMIEMDALDFGAIKLCVQLARECIRTRKIPVLELVE